MNFVCTDENDEVLGYCFCLLQRQKAHSVLTDIKTLYIDDLCVDEGLRGKHIGTQLYKAAVALAKENGLVELTIEAYNQNGDLVLTDVTEAIVKCKRTE